MKKLYKFLAYLFIFLAVSISISIIILVIRSFKNVKPKKVATNPEYKHTGKCIACERQFSENTRWMGQSNKCYDCERDLIVRSGGDFSAAYDGVKSKCFDC